MSPLLFHLAEILPWLYRLTEINNMIPDLEQRTRLGQRLIAVFSTAAFCILPLLPTYFVL